MAVQIGVIKLDTKYKTRLISIKYQPKKFVAIVVDVLGVVVVVVVDINVNPRNITLQFGQNQVIDR